MKLNIFCGDKSFSSSYTYWYKIRSNIIKASIDYIKYKFNKNNELYKMIDNKDDKNYIGKGSYYNCCMNDMNHIINAIYDENMDNIMKNFIRLTSELKTILVLNYFELGGLFALCNQSDCGGYYTPGNSLDICLLLDKIKFCMKKYEGYNCIYNTNVVSANAVYQIFENSYKKLINVSLC
jgi:hypothetical protein